MGLTSCATLPFLPGTHVFSTVFKILQENSTLFKHLWLVTLRSIKDAGTADQCAMELVEVVAKLKRLRYVVDDFQKSGRMNLVKTRDMERISRRAEEAEMAVSASMARLIVETDVVTRSPLLSRAMGLYRDVMYAR